MNTPLVTVGVVTYNSEEFIKETLDSIYNQDYPNVELIISDDCSTDDTVKVCKSWISKHESRFNGIKLVTADKNTGVSGNSNRALKEAHGEWYKCFDGDDILLPHAISSYVEYVNEHPEASQVVAKVENFNGKDVSTSKVDNLTKYVCRESATAKYQLSVITKTLFFRCSSHFAKTNAIRSVGAFDERFPMLEDYPLMVRLIGGGYRVYFLDLTVVRYRERKNSIAHSTRHDSIFTNNIIRQYLEYRMLFRVEYCTGFWKRINNFSIWMVSEIEKHGNNQTLQCRALFMLYRLIDPIIWSNRFLSIKAALFNLTH